MAILLIYLVLASQMVIVLEMHKSR